MGTYKDENGTTRVGDFLRSIGKSEILEKVLNVGGSLVTGNFGGAIKEALLKSKDLTPEQTEYALKMAELDAKEDIEITERWKADMNSDSWLSKNVRPATLVFMTICTFLLIFIDSASLNFTVSESYVTLMQTLLVTVYVAYFGSRGFEKYQKIKK